MIHQSITYYINWFKIYVVINAFERDYFFNLIQLFYRL